MPPPPSLFTLMDSILNCNFLKPFVTLNTENTEILLCTNISCQNQCVFIAPIILKLGTQIYPLVHKKTQPNLCLQQ